MAGYKSLQLSDALNRVTQQLKPQVTTGTLENSVYGRNTNTPDATAQVRADLIKDQQYYDSIYSKTGSDYAQDAAVALGKGIVSVPQAAAGLVDLVDAGAQGLATLGTDEKVQGGRFTKGLEDVGVRFKDTQDIMSGWYSEGTQKQLQGLAQLPGMSTEKSLGDNLSSLGQTAGYVLDNPSLALNTIIESLPSIAAGGVVGRGAAALGGKAVAGAVGEGTVMAGQAQANMDRGADGYTTGNQALGALGIGILGGAVGQLGGRIAHRAGAEDINQLASGVSSQSANQGFKSLGVGTITEAAEEAAQSSLENVISNITSGKDAIQGLNQDLVLGTLAGAGMGGAVNAKSALSSEALNAVTNAYNKQAEKIKERISRDAPERTDTPTENFANPAHADYNPTAAIIRAGKVDSNSTVEEVSQARTNVDSVMETAETRLSELTEMKKALESEETWKNNLVNAQNAVAQFAETEPERAEKAQNAIDQIITPKLEQIEQIKQATDLDKVNEALAHTDSLVKDARVIHDKYSTMLGQTEESMSTDKQIFGAPTSFSLEQIQSVIDDASIPDTSKVALRALSTAVQAQNAVKDLDAVNQQVTGASLDPNYMSTPQYLDQFGSAIQRGSVKAQQNLLNQISDFETSHTAKAKLADTAFKLANRTGQSLQIVNADGQWVVNTGTRLKGDEAKANGALTIHPAKNGKKGSADLVNYMNTEAKAITATRTAMEEMQKVQTPSQVEQAPQSTPNASVDLMQDAMDSYNQDLRDNYDYQPERKATDPRSNETRPSTTETKSAEATVQPEVQPTAGTASGTVNTELPKPNTQEYELVFDENGVGSNVPKAVSKPINISSKGTGLAKALTNPNNEYPINYLGKEYSSVEHAYQSNKSGTFDPAAYESGKGKFKVAGKLGTDTSTSLQLMVDLLKAKLEQYPSLIESIKSNGGTDFINSSTHNVVGDKFWESTGNNGFIKALSKAYTEIVSNENIPKTLAQTERVASRSDSEGVATEAQVSTDTANQVTQEESTEEVVSSEVKTEVVPQDPNTAEKADKNPKRTAERELPMNKRNLVIDGFNQRETVLNKNDNFMARFMQRDNLAPVIESITGDTPSAKQVAALKDFSKFFNYFSPKMTNLIGSKKEEFRFQDFNQFLLEDGTLPENIKTAVASAMFTWVAENGSKTLSTEKEVGGLLLLKNVTSVPNHIFTALSPIGNHQSLVVASLGQKAMQALGLKVVSDVDPARKQKLEASLGNMAMVLLVNNGYLNRQTMKVSDFLSMKAETAVDTDDINNLKVGLPNDGKEMSFLVPVSGAKVDQVIKSAAETKGIVHSIFGVQRDIKLPSLEAVTTTPSSFNRMGSELPSYTEEMLEAAQKNGYKMSAPAMTFMDNVKHEDLRELFGYIKPNADGESFTGMHKKFWKGQLASNEAVERAIAIIKEQRVNLGDDSKEFFFAHTSWTNTRSGYDAAFNLQANKMHRAVAGMTDHVVEVGIEPVMRNGETTKFGEFLMAVAMTAEEIPMGLNTVDKVSSETYLAAFQEYLQRDNVQAGIEAMADVIETGKGDMASIKALVKEFGMGAMSVRGIQALAQMYIAERDGARTFTSDIGFESDGVTNGPIITNVALATAYAEMLEAGGIFLDKSKTNVPTNKERGSKDIYEQLGEVMQAKWAVYKASLKPKALKSAEALDTIYKAFGKRKGAKPITTTSNYGAGIASIKRANGREVLNAFYKGLESAAKDGDMAQAQKLINAVNETIDTANFYNKTNTPKAVVKGNPMEFLLTPAQESALLDITYRMHGEAIKNTLDEAMKDFQEVRDELTGQAVAGFKIYELIRNKALEEAMKDTTDVLVDGKGQRKEGLTSDQLKKVLKSIERYTPSVVSGMGNMSDNKKKSSIPLMKQEALWDDSTTGDLQNVFKGKWQGEDKGSFTLRASIKRDGVTDPGVSGLALIIQSIDAMIAHTTIGNIPSQNYHDANASAVGQGKAMARVQNEAFVDGLMTTHVNREFTRALMNPLKMALEDSKFLTENEVTIKDALNEFNPNGSLEGLVDGAYNRDLAKLRNMLTWSNVNQYGTQGGHFIMTDAKRVEILKQQEKLKKDYAKDLAIASKLDSMLNVRANTNTVEGLLRLNGTLSADKAVPLLQAELSKFQGDKGDKGKFSQFYDSILDLVTERMPAGLEIKLFNELDVPKNVSGFEEASKNGNPAWFTTGKDGKPQINIIRTDAPIRAQVLVHELVHAITVDSIAQVRNDPTAHAEAKESLDKIDALYEHVKAKVNADPKASKLMKYAVKNVEEFIATGFSYPEFVNYLDNQIAPKAARGKSRIVTALRSFVENILGVLESFTGRKYSAEDATALEALILDSTEFLERTKPPTVGTQTTSYGAPQQARDKVAGFTSKEVFASLDSNLDPQFQTHLSQMMSQVSDTIYDGLNQKLVDNPDGTWSVEKAWDEYINQGKAVTSETATTAGFRMSEQESFAVESLYAALTHGLKDKAMTQIYAEMRKAFEASRAKLKPQDFYEGDWATADKYDRQDAQDMYDFIFKYGKDNPEPLARFVAMALGSQQFSNMLGFTVKDTTQASTGTFEKLVEGTNDLMNYVGGLLTNSSSAQLVNNKLGLLAKELARIDAKNRDFAISKVEAQIEKLVDHTDAVSQKMRDKVIELADHDALANSRFAAVRLASNVTALSAKGDLWTTLDVIKETNTMNNQNQRLGMVGEIINEAANNDDTKKGVEKMMRLTKLNNQMKENIRDTTRKNVMSTFEENGSYLTMEDKASISTMLRSDVQALADTYDTKEIARMYSDSSFLNQEIKSIESQLKDQVMANRAKQLAKYMITGKSSLGLAKNARLIVSGFNTGEVVADTDPRIDLVDRLASMYAIQYTPQGDKARLNLIMKRELKNKTNGIDTSIKFHKEMAKVAQDTLFVDNLTSAIKGYVPEITNPNKEIRIASNNAEAQLLKDQFYTEVKELGKAKLDPNTSPRLFITEEANIQRLVSGAIEVVSTNRKGTQVTLDGNHMTNVVNQTKKGIPTSPAYNPMTDADVYMTPNYNTQNEIIGFSYEMSGKNRDNLLERNNDFSELLGAYAATNFNKVTVPEQNNKVVDAALEDYKDNFAKNPRAYVTVGPNSNDQGLREVWAMLPESTRKHIIQTWGKDGMQVRNDVLLTMFGYRKYSLNQSFDKMDEAKNMFEKLYTGIMTELFGSNAKIRGVQAERAWQESISLMKDIIVIRNVKTMVANTVSNAMLLSAHGVSPADIVKDTVLAVRAGMQYRKEMAQLLSAQQKQRAGVGDFNKLEQEVLRLQDSLSRNPLAGFIEEGMMPTIVEDVDPDTNHYSYKNKLQQRIDDATDIVPKSVKTAAKWAMVSPDTPLYKFLNNATQFSDFSSKYVMYKYYTQKAKEKLSHDEALQIASDNFVNYDIPTSRGLQYLNDMGVVMFTKYNIRIQKALFQLLKKRPATAMAQAVFINSFTNLEAGIDPLIWFNMGNPLRTGALGLPSALDEPLPIKMMTSVF